MMRITKLAGSVLATLAAAACGPREVPSATDADAAETAAVAENAAERCAAVGDAVEWPDPSTRTASAEWHSSPETLNGPQGTLSLPVHCEVIGEMHAREGARGQRYAIRFKVRLPEAWNGKFFFQGGGGTNGNIGNAVGIISPGAPTALEQGYAVVSQDSGHDNERNTVPELGGAVAFGFDEQARADYGGASLEPVAVAAKALIRAFYARPPERSYFFGCSKGGQEGMALAQQHPDVFDGIVAGAPGFSLPRAAIAEAWDTQAFASLIEPEGGKRDVSKLPQVFSDAQFARVRTAVLAACDADDGADDGITADWNACSWSRVQPKLTEQVCSDAPDCLSAKQVEVLGKVLGGPKDSRGEALYSDWAVDAGLGSPGWRAWKIGPAGGTFPGINVAMGGPALAAIFTTPPTEVGADPAAAFEYVEGFDFDRDAPKIEETNYTFTRSAWDDISARSTDLSGFRASGAKMIVPQGVSDPVFSVKDTVAWYSDVDRLNDGHAADFVRVFPVPGMAHCAGGPATDQFNALDALVAWVELGEAPDRIEATAGPMSPWPGRTRPLCPFPQVARYTGEGSLEDAASFRCE